MTSGVVRFRVTGWNRLRVIWAMLRGCSLAVEFDQLEVQE